VLLAVVALAGCGGGAASDEPTVVAGLYPLAWAVGQIAGDRHRVVDVTPPGAEPHDVELSPRDVEEILGADLVVYVGGGFQPAIEDAVEALGRSAAGERLASRLLELHREYEAGLAHCTRRTIVTTHAAFGRLAARYGLEQLALAGTSPEAEPTARDLEGLIEQVRASGATTVFSEPLASDRVPRTVAREAGLRVGVLDPVEGLTDNGVEAGADYLTVMRDDLEALREALGCR